MTKQAIDIRLDFLRTLFCETKPKTKEDFKLLNTIKESIIKLNERKLCPGWTLLITLYTNYG